MNIAFFFMHNIIQNNIPIYIYILYYLEDDILVQYLRKYAWRILNMKMLLRNIQIRLYEFKSGLVIYNIFIVLLGNLFEYMYT